MLDLMRADFGEPFEEGVTYPEWAIRCGKKVCRALFPMVYELEGAESLRRAHELGLARGLLEGAQVQLAGALSELAPLADREPTEEEKIRLSEMLFGKESGLSLSQEAFGFVPREVLDELDKMTESFSLEEWGLYYGGMSAGCLMLAGRNAATLATNLYSTMLLYWRVVERLESVERLHAFLTKVHGQNVVGSDIKRTRQLCGRIGKRFAPPGRPKKLPHAPKPAK
jgi:hypothetical protein